MVKIFSYLLIFILGFAIASAVGYLTIVGPSERRINELRVQHSLVAEANNRLAERLIDRERTLVEAKQILTSSGTSVAKLREIINMLKNYDWGSPASLTN